MLQDFTGVAALVDLVLIILILHSLSSSLFGICKTCVIDCFLNSSTDIKGSYPALVDPFGTSRCTGGFLNIVRSTLNYKQPSLFANSLIAVQNDGLYLSQITRETCTVCESNPKRYFALRKFSFVLIPVKHWTPG